MLILDRNGGRERERHIHVWETHTCTLPIAEWAWNVGMCSDPRNQMGPFGASDHAQWHEPHQPGLWGSKLVFKNQALGHQDFVMWLQMTTSEVYFSRFPLTSLWLQQFSVMHLKFFSTHNEHAWFSDMEVFWSAALKVQVPSLGLRHNVLIGLRHIANTNLLFLFC